MNVERRVLNVSSTALSGDAVVTTVVFTVDNEKYVKIIVNFLDGETREVELTLEEFKTLLAHLQQILKNTVTTEATK
ncbi:hypothetical protein DRO69_02150 [Candidatus Bathyarchaeota archaeon]|nr:MAG: hypothetical protein DRO69_02150 [Candidatus Bathyarchaeota archaeon]